jgi:hypothetical protein
MAICALMLLQHYYYMKSLILLMNKKNTVGYLIGLSAISLALILSMTLSNNNGAIAQQSSPSATSTNSGNNKTISITMTPNRQQQQNPYSMSASSGSQNWTGSISLFSPIIDAFKSKIHTTLNNATTNAIKALGGGSNSSAVAAFIHPQRGFLVYDVFVLDSSNNIHRVIVDPGNGKVLSNQLMSMMDMMSMMHPSMGMGRMMMGHPSMMMDHSGGMGIMMGPPQDSMMMNRGMMMDHSGGMGMMGPSNNP